MRHKFIVAGLSAIALAGAAHAQDSSASSQASRAAVVKSVLASLHPQKGDVAVPGADATLHLGDRYYFLNAADSRRVLVEGWQNPPDEAEGVIGMVFPAGTDFTNPDGWGAVITYQNDGYVSDSDAKTTDYNKLLEDLRKGEDDDNAQRKQQGQPAVHLVGWAQPPSYDPAHHSLIWARDLQFSDQSYDTLNYDVRELGRRGVLSLNIISAMPQLASVRSDAQNLGAVADFNPGARYADYRGGVDKKAAYGIAGLIAAGAGVAVAQKAGLFAAGLLLLKKVWVLIAAGGAALATRLRGLFGKKATPAS